MSELALELLQVSRRFGDVAALVDAELAVRTGTVHALLGENGAGKTTLVRIAYGMLRPDRGTFRIGDIERHFESPADAIGAGVGMVQQHPSNVGAMTVWENVVLGGKGGLDPADARRKVGSLIGNMGFSMNVDALVADLPVAAQQRVEILKAVFRQARLLLLDEPTAILAPEEASELYSWLRTFAAGGGTAIVVTHKLEEAREFADDLTVLRAGRTVLQARASTVSTEDLTRAMIGDALSLSGPSTAVTAGGAVLRADGLTLLDNRRVAVVRNASFEVRSGEILGVAGVEGSGHHQLLMAIAGRHPASAGRIDHESRTSIIPEDRHRDAVVLPFSLAENAALRNAGRARGVVGWSAVSSRVSGWLDRFDVRATSPSVPMRTLSGGNQQKFVLARELDGDPRLIVAENPTRGLDIRATAFVHAQLRSAREGGVAVVLYSSDLDEIMELADRVLVVHGGKVVEVEKDRTRIGAAMLGAA